MEQFLNEGLNGKVSIEYLCGWRKFEIRFGNSKILSAAGNKIKFY